MSEKLRRGKKTRVTGRYFYRIFFPFICITSAVAVLLSLYFYRQYEERYRDTCGSTSRQLITGVQQSTESLLRQMQQIYDAIAVEADISQMLSLSESDPTAHYKAYMALNRIIVTNTEIYEAAVVNSGNGDVVYSGADTLDVDEAIERLQENRDQMVYAAELTERDEGLPVLVFAYPFYDYSYSDNPNGVFLTVTRESALQAVMPGISETQACVITDAEGTVLLENEAENFTVGDEMLSDLMAAGEAAEGEDSYSLQNGQNRYLCSMLTDAETGWHFYLVTSEDEIFSALRAARNSMLAVFGLIILAALLIQYFVTRRIYAPVRKITAEMAGRAGKSADSADEFALIQDSYQQILAEMENLEQKSTLYALKEKSDLLRQLLLQEGDPAETDKNLRKRGYELSYDSLFLIDLEIFSNQDSGLFPKMMLTGIQKILTDSLSEDFIPNSVQISDHEVAELLSVRSGSAVTYDDLIRKLENVRQIILTSWDVRLCLGVGGGIISPESCGNVYREVREMMQNRFTLGFNQVIDRKKIADLMDEPLEYPDRIMDEIARDIIAQKEQAFEGDLDAIRGIIVQYSYQAANLIYAKLVLRVFADLDEKGIRLRMDSLEENPFAVSSLEEGLACLRRFYEIAGEQQRQMESLRSNRQYDAVRKGEEYIRTHYMDSGLSTEQIASQLGYTASYYSRIFKTVNGSFIGDYIRQVRVMKAQELLQNSSMTVQEISEAAGFTTSNYFYSVFKKETGLTPAAYRSASQRGQKREER
ncbi:MAG: helix-turn-helix domain-containing protein [Lachnospiraceae bacterium]|jgi:AraC-like DNA-binding protein